jgi:hypothetical protein
MDGLFGLVLFLNGILALTASMFSRSAVVRFIIWVLLPIVIALIVIGPKELIIADGEKSMWMWAVFFYFVAMGFVFSGFGTLLGYFIRRTRVVREKVPKAKVQEPEPYRGPRCVACFEPIELGVALCPHCGWTQPA